MNLNNAADVLEWPRGELWANVGFIAPAEVRQDDLVEAADLLIHYGHADDFKGLKSQADVIVWAADNCEFGLGTGSYFIH